MPTKLLPASSFPLQPHSYILMTSKSEISSGYAFCLLKTIFNNMGYPLKVRKVMTDFEAPLRKKLKYYFPNIEVLGCFFHFVKALWSKLTTSVFDKKFSFWTQKSWLFYLSFWPISKLLRKENNNHKCNFLFQSDDLMLNRDIARKERFFCNMRS